MKKFFSLAVQNQDGLIWCVFVKKDKSSIVLPQGTIFQATEHYRGEVVNHYYDAEKDEFTTNITISHPVVLNFQLLSLKLYLTEKAWVVEDEDLDLMARDKVH